MWWDPGRAAPRRARATRGWRWDAATGRRLAHPLGLSLATWLLFVVTLVPEELAAGAVAATTATLAMAVVHRYEPLALDLAAALRWLVTCWRIPFQVVTDTVRLAAALWRQVVRGEPVRGRFRALPFPRDEPVAIATTRELMATTLASLGPNTYVVGIQDGQALIHQLLPDRADPIPPGLLAPANRAPRP